MYRRGPLDPSAPNSCSCFDGWRTAPNRLMNLNTHPSSLCAMLISLTYGGATTASSALTPSSPDTISPLATRPRCSWAWSYRVGSRPGTSIPRM